MLLIIGVHLLSAVAHAPSIHSARERNSIMMSRNITTRIDRNGSTNVNESELLNVRIQERTQVIQQLESMCSRLELDEMLVNLMKVGSSEIAIRKRRVSLFEGMSEGGS